MDSSIEQNIKSFHRNLPENVTLVAVSKFNPVTAIEEAYNAGQRIFGESKVQELADKYEKLPKDIKWHFIGHLQTNKVKYITPFISLIQSVDSVKLLSEINKSGIRINRIIDVLLQFHVAQEETKYGFDIEEIVNLFTANPVESWSNIRFRGIMGMATFTNNEVLIKSEFQQLENIFRFLKEEFFLNDQNFNIKSYGMSSDYNLAMKTGSNMIRVGSNIFGERMYL